jgi:dTDP-glucose pyrophosphorylase
MKALVLAAGRGTRMNQLTDDAPKPLIEINGRTFLDYVIENITKTGIDDVGVVVGYRKEMIIESLKEKVNEKAASLKLTFIEQEEQLGTGHAVKMAREWSGGDEFIVLMGDNLYSSDDIRSISVSDGFCYVAGYEHKTPEKFGVLATSNGILESITEKPSVPPSNLINTGLYKFTPDIFNVLGSIGKSERGEYEITDAINILCREKKVRFVRLKDYWLNLGCPEDIPSIKKFLSEGTNKS